jgi:hypothetical protein
MADLRKQSGVRGPTQGQYNKPSVSFPTPETGEYIVVERKTVDSKEQPIAYGTAHPTLADAKLIKQSFELEEDGKKTRLRIYAKRGSTTVQNAYNFALQFAADSNAHRVLIRSYLLPAPVTALAKGTADSVIATCILTKEEHAPRGGEDNHHIQVTRIYEELPGPWIPFTRYDEAYGPIQGRRRAVVNTNQAASITANGSLSYESREGSNYVVMETEESWNLANAPDRETYTYDSERGRVKQTRKLVSAAADATLAISTGTVTEISFTPVNEIVWDRITEVWHTEEHNLTSQRWDDAIRAMVTITTNIVAHNAALTFPTYYLDVEETPLSKVAKRRTIVSIASLPSTITEYKTDQFTFPAILEAIAINKYAVGNLGGFGNPATESSFWSAKNTVVIINPTIRPAVSLPTEHKVVTSYHASAPSRDVVYTVAPNNCQFQGRLLNFSLGQVLMDTLTFSVSADSFDANYAGLTEAATIGASSPSATAYLAAIGDEKLISCDVTLYRGNIWMKRNIYINLK